MPELPLPAFEQRLQVLGETIPDSNDSDMILLRLFHYIASRHIVSLNQILKPFNLQHHEWYILMILYSESSQKILPSQLSDMLDLTRTSITRLSDDLVRKGLIERYHNPQDRRQVILQLTGKARWFIAEIAPLMKSTRQKILHDFSEHDKTALEQYLRQILNTLDQAIQEKPVQKEQNKG